MNNTTLTSVDSVAITSFYLRASEAPLFSGQLNAALSAATLSAAGIASAFSTEFGHTLYGDDYMSSTVAPPNGMLLSFWSKRTDPAVSFPFTSGNRELMSIAYANLYLRIVGFNCSAASSGDTDCWYNANSMMVVDGTSVGESATSNTNDYSWYGANGHTVAQLNGWIFHAFQVYIDSANSQIILRLWVKFGSGAVEGPFTSTITYTDLRATLVSAAGWTQAHADAWTPSTTTTGFTIGDNYDISQFYGIHARLYTATGTPTNAEIETIAATTGADTGAWGDWSLEWSGGATSMTDRSGHSRNLTTIAGTFYAGPAFP